MPLMLTVIFVCIAIGLLVPRFSPRVYLIIAALAATMTALYYLVPPFM
jgi:hypothetical protein